jgi:iron(III) transport system ATP-binding protein
MTEIKLINISKRFGQANSAVNAVDGVNLVIAPGEFFFLLGPSGCGKTTLLRIIAGLIEPSAGQIFFGNRDVTTLLAEDRRSAMVFQNYALWPHMTVTKNVEFGPKMRHLPADRRRQIAAEALHRVQMDQLGGRKPSQLSGGQQQRVALARALAAEGDCILLDEPLSNLDARLRLHMRLQLRQIVKSSGITAVYVTHDQKEALSMADRIAVMDAGKIVQVGPPHELYSRPASRFVADFLGEANFAQGQITPASQQGETVKIETKIGDVHACAALLPAGRNTVTICIRPEHLSISPACPDEQVPGQNPNESACRLRATVVATTYLGEMRQYNCQLADGSIWRVSILADIAKPLSPGQAVDLCAAASNVIVLGD